MTALVQITAPAVDPVTLAEVKSHVRLDATNAEPSPLAVTAALAGAGAGNVDNGAHRYFATFVTADGETEAGVVSAAVTVLDKTTNGKVALSAIPTGGSYVTARKLYRTIAGGSSGLLLATIADNTTTVYTDNTADSGLGVGMPTVNTTADPLLRRMIADATTFVESYLRRLLITQTWELSLDRFPAWVMNVPNPKLQSVTSIKYLDTNGTLQTLDPSQYVVDSNTEPARITPAYGLIWPLARYQMNAITVRFVAGYGDAASAVPAGIKTVLLMYLATLFENPDLYAVQSSRAQVVEFPEKLLDRMIGRYRAAHFTWAADVSVQTLTA